MKMKNPIRPVVETMFEQPATLNVEAHNPMQQKLGPLGRLGLYGATQKARADAAIQIERETVAATVDVVSTAIGHQRTLLKLALINKAAKQIGALGAELTSRADTVHQHLTDVRAASFFGHLGQRKALREEARRCAAAGEIDPEELTEVIAAIDAMVAEDDERSSQNTLRVKNAFDMVVAKATDHFQSSKDNLK
jgi:hypothetical protein